TLPLYAAEIACLAAHLPAIPFTRSEGTDRTDPVLRRMERVRAKEGEGVEAVIFGTPGHPITCDAKTDPVAGPGLHPQRRGKIVEAVRFAARAEGVDAVAALPAEPRADADIAGPHRI